MLHLVILLLAIPRRCLHAGPGNPAGTVRQCVSDTMQCTVMLTRPVVSVTGTYDCANISGVHSVSMHHYPPCGHTNNPSAGQQNIADMLHENAPDAKGWPSI